MMVPFAGRLVLVLALLMGVRGRQARAETRRIAVVVGSNRGEATRPALRFAEQDAFKFAAVLSELGGLAPSDVLLLRGPSPVEVRAALDEATRRIVRWHEEHRGQAALIVYYSGHSDGAVLELGGQRLPFAELRQRVTAAGAEVRLMILDSCRSGALLALKGGTLGQPFDIRLADDLVSTGEAMIASSAADEAALESSEIGASFFSHHFISGLRGAADASGDGVVTLAEAYQYAFARTMRTTSETTVGPQHPAYDYHLAGRGDLVLTRLQQPSAVLGLPGGFDRLLLVSTPKEQVLVELGPRSAHRIAVPNGTYRVRGWKGSQSFGAQVTLAQGQELRLASADMIPMHVGSAVAKGELAPAVVVSTASVPTHTPPNRSPWSVSFALGLLDGAAKDALLAGGRFGLEHVVGARKLAVVLSAGTGRAPSMRENRVSVAVLPSWWLGADRVRAGLGLGLGAGAGFERVDKDGQTHWTGLAFVSPTALVEFRLAHRFALQASAELPITLFRRDNQLTAAPLASAWLGLARAL